YAYLLWGDGKGTVTPLYPWNDDELKVESVAAAPPAVDLLGERQRNQLLQDVLNKLGLLLSLQQDAGLPARDRYAAVLSWKGRVAARGVLDRLLPDEPDLKADVEKLQAARARLARLARLALRTPPPAQQAAWLKQVQALTEQKEALEAVLSRNSSAFRKQKER